MHFEEWMERVVQAFEVAGVGILAIGSLAALVGAARTLARGERRVAYQRARQDVGRAVLLGLEVLIIRVRRVPVSESGALRCPD